MHRRKIVGSFDGFYLELSVFAALRPPVLEPHRRADGIRALSGRDVKADERARESLQTQFASELVYWIAGALLCFHRRKLQLLQQMPRVLLCQRNQIAARTALRNQNLGVRQGLFDQLSIRKVERQEQLSRALLHSDIATREKDRQDVGILLLGKILEESLIARQQLPAPDPE